MDDLKRWASIVAPASASGRITREQRGSVREHTLTTMLRAISAVINERRNAGLGVAYIRDLDVPGPYLHEVVQVLEHQGYKVSGVSHSISSHKAYLDISWEAHTAQQKYTGDAICGLHLFHGGCSPSICDLPKGHGGACAAGTLDCPRCGAPYTYSHNGVTVEAVCGMPKGHKNIHYSIDELNGPPGPARN